MGLCCFWCQKENCERREEFFFLQTLTGFLLLCWVRVCVWQTMEAVVAGQKPHTSGSPLRRRYLTDPSDSSFQPWYEHNDARVAKISPCLAPLSLTLSNTNTHALACTPANPPSHVHTHTRTHTHHSRCHSHLKGLKSLTSIQSRQKSRKSSAAMMTFDSFILSWYGLCDGTCVRLRCCVCVCACVCVHA